MDLGMIQWRFNEIGITRIVKLDTCTINMKRLVGVLFCVYQSYSLPVPGSIMTHLIMFKYVCTMTAVYYFGISDISMLVEPYITYAIKSVFIIILIYM